jgi:hypothetical protein
LTYFIQISKTYNKIKQSKNKNIRNI